MNEGGLRLFERLDRYRSQSATLRRIIDFVGNGYLSLWNHVFAFLPGYALRLLIARHMYGMRVGKANLHRGVFLLSPWLIEVGDNVNVQMGCFLDGRGGLTIGNNVDLLPGARLLTEQHDIDSAEYETVKRSVHIADNAIVGSWALILPGVTVSEGAVVAAGSVVTKTVEPYTLVAGNPAVMKRERCRDIGYELDFRRPFH